MSQREVRAETLGSVLLFNAVAREMKSGQSHLDGNATYQELGGCRCSMGRGKVITTLANPSDLSLTRKAEQASQ
jgi:hypothetical protein